MPRAKKTWGEKMKAKPPHHVVLEKDFAGIPKGAKLHISCPIEIAAEHAWEEYGRTGSTRDLAPFWRVVESNSPMAKKLSFDSSWIDLQRELES